MRGQHGFSLVELAMVLFIITLVLGGLLVPLATQMETRQRNDAGEQLERIKEALIGFALINGRLPCYTSEADPASDAYGEEDAPCNPTGRTTDGFLPWKTLGLTSGLDPWGVPRNAASDPWLGHWRYRVDTSFFTSFGLSTVAVDGLSVEELDLQNSSVGSPVYRTLTGSEPPIVIIYSTGVNRTPDGQNVSYEKASADDPTYEGGMDSNLDRDNDGDEDEFDDIATWISRPTLFNRMVTAGRLP